MTMPSLWERFYREAVAREKQLRDEKHELHMRLIRCEGQRLSMLFTLELMIDFVKRGAPEYAQHILNCIRIWRDQYEGKQLEKTLGEIASLAPAISGSAGSSSNPQTETSVGMSQGSTEWEGMTFPKRQ